MGRITKLFVNYSFIILGGLLFHFSDAISCGGNIFSQNERIVSPYYPSTYVDRLNCRWSIHRPGDNEIFLNISYFSTEIGYDFLHIIDKNTGIELANLDGRCFVPGDGWFSTNSNDIELHFTTDGSNVLKGFEILMESRNASQRQSTPTPERRIICNGHTLFDGDVTSEDYDIDTTESYSLSWIDSATQDYSKDGVKVRIEYGSFGRIFFEGHEICSSQNNYRYGDMWCRAKGFLFSNSFSSVTPRDPYNTVNISCSYYHLFTCRTEFIYNYCASVDYLSCYEEASITQPTTVILGYSSVYIGNEMKGKVYVNGYEVCADGVNNQTYEALCQTNGFHFHYYNSSYAHDPYQTLDINCSDTNIQNCSAEYRNQYCSNALYLFCDGLGLRLVGTGYPWKGTIEIMHNDQWGTICDDSFDKQDGDVICRMLGYSHSSQTYQSAYYGQGSGQIWLDDLDCYGFESDVAYCNSSGWGIHNCGHHEDAGVDCSYYEATTFDPCYGYPCRHGGTCYRNSGNPGYYCACANGYSGLHCDTSVGFSAENSISVACTDNTWDISVYLPPFYNRYHNFNPSDIYLGNDSCTGYVSGNFLYFRSDYSACDTVTWTLTDHVVYTNQLVYALHDPTHHFTLHEYLFSVPVDCYLKRNKGGSGHFNHGHDVTIPSAHHVTGSTPHSVHLQFYTDWTFRYTKPLYGSRVGDRVYVKAYTDVRDYNIKMRISDCFTTPTSSTFSSMKYFIIQNGCVIDPNARILSQTTHETRFYFQDFEYSTNHDFLYLHCNATFCESNDYSSSCEQACSHPRKRVGGGDIVHSGPVESMAVNEAVRLTKADDVGGSSKRGSSTVTAVLSIIFGTIVITLVAFMVLGKIKRLRQKRTQVV